MPWKLNLLTQDQMLEKRRGEGLSPGDCWFCPWLSSCLSPEYERDWKGKREPLCIHLPDKSDWLVDGIASNLNGHGWVVTGTFPNLTAKPSIGKYTADKKAFTYHGWLTNGELSNDIDGKTY